MNKRINLALQGVGSHGAYAWGVLDRLLEDGRLQVDGMCGTSSGAMNASVFAYGYMKGGADGARSALEHFWRRISEAGAIYSPVGASTIHGFPGAEWLRQLGYAASTR